MKKYIIPTILLSAAALMSGCSLQEEPYSLTAEELATTGEGAEQLVTGIYATFWDHWCMQQTYMAWMDYDHDHCGGPSWVLSSAGSGDVTSHFAYNTMNDLWTTFYCMINRSNSAREALEKNDSYKEVPAISQLYGETLFMRAFAYFHLVRMYGAVPLRLTSDSDNDCPRSSVEDVYNQITSDLETSLEYLRFPSDGGVGAWGHADKTAAMLLLARVYNTMGSAALTHAGTQIKVDIKGEEHTYTCSPVDGTSGIDAAKCYRRSKELCDEVIGRRGIDFDLMPGFRYIWGTNNARNKEFVWGAASNGADETFCTSGLNNYFTPAPFGGSGTWIYMSHNCYNLYEENDDRIVDGVFHYYLVNYNKGQKWVSYPSKSDRYNEANLPADYKAYADGFNTSYTKGVACMTKHYNGDITKPSFYSAKQNAKTNQDIILIRFAEAYLLRAEAEVEVGTVADAMADLDVIRKRAGASIYSGKITDKVEARSLVLKERALELAMECNRKFDLLRWGLYLDVMNDTQSIDCAGTLRSMVRTKKNLLYAIPTAEIAANKLLGGNNYGY